MDNLEKDRALRAFMTRMNKEFAKGKGHKVIAFADEVGNPYFLRRPSGIMQLDIDTGGGLPAGGISILSGPDQAGKNFLLNKYIAMQQKLYGNSCKVAIAHVETPPDHFFMRKCGVRVAIPDAMVDERDWFNKERGLPSFTKEERKSFKEQVGKIVIIREETSELLFKAILEAVRSNVFSIIGLDSISAIQSNAEAGIDGFEQMPQQAADAGLITRFYKKYAPLTLGLKDEQNESTLIFTSQVRSNRKKSEVASFNPHLARMMKEYDSGGSYANRHGKLIEISLWNGKRDRSKQTIDGKEVKIAEGKTICWELKKGKAGTHDGITGEVEFSYETLTEDLRTVLVAGIRHGVIVEKSGLITVLNATTREPTTMANIPGPDEFCARLQADFVLELAVRREILVAAGKQCRYQ